MYIADDSSGNTIGGTTGAVRNVISGNIDGIVMSADSGDVVVGNYIGTDATGMVAIGNGTSDNGGGDGVFIEDGASDTIGGATSSARNIISGDFNGVSIGGGSAVDNVIQGNYIGTDPTGTIAVSNVGHGVLIEASGGANTIGGATSIPGTGAGNLISGNGYGVAVIYETGPDVILGNAIGTIALAGGTSSPGNAGGIIVQYSSDTQVGGSSPGDGNLISGNTGGVGLAIGESGQVLVQGNLIGTDSSGTVAVPNGIGLTLGLSGDNTIGGTTPGAGNVISGNTDEGLGIVSGDGLDILKEPTRISSRGTGSGPMRRVPRGSGTTATACP